MAAVNHFWLWIGDGNPCARSSRCARCQRPRRRVPAWTRTRQRIRPTYDAQLCSTRAKLRLCRNVTARTKMYLCQDPCAQTTAVPRATQAPGCTASSVRRRWSVSKTGQKRDRSENRDQLRSEWNLQTKRRGYHGPWDGRRAMAVCRRRGYRGWC